jgi:hypothetical protein
MFLKCGDQLIQPPCGVPDGIDRRHLFTNYAKIRLSAAATTLS